MKRNAKLKNTLAALAKLQIDLEKKGGPSEDGQMFEQIIATHAEILKGFGLPTSSNNKKLLWFGSLPTDIEVEEIIRKLCQAATDYLLSPAMSELKLLKNALETGEDAFNILPELKIETHVYPIFVYEKIFLKQKDTVENVLKELKLSNSDENLDLLGRFASGSEENPPDLEKQLIEKGIRYTQQFIISNSEFLSDDDY
jgi:hypothetical protein